MERQKEGKKINVNKEKKNKGQKFFGLKKYFIFGIVAIVFLFGLYVTKIFISGDTCKGLYENGYLYFNSDLNDFIISKDDTLMSHSKKEIKVSNVDYIIKVKRWKCLLKLLKENGDVKFFIKNNDIDVLKKVNEKDNIISGNKESSNKEPSDKEMVYIVLQNEDNPSIKLISYIAFLHNTFETSICNDKEEIKNIGDLVTRLRESFAKTGINDISNVDIIEFFEESDVSIPRSIKKDPKSLDNVFDKIIQGKTIERVCEFINNNEKFYRFYDSIFDYYYNIENIIKDKNIDIGKDVRLVITTYEPQRTAFRVVIGFDKSEISMNDILLKINEIFKA